MGNVGEDAVYNIKGIIKLYKKQAPILAKIRRDLQKLPLKEREAVIIRLYLESQMDEVDIAEKLDLTTIEIVRVLQANGIY